jgi:hypothetical protein
MREWRWAMERALIAIQTPGDIMFSIEQNLPSASLDGRVHAVPDPDNPNVVTTSTKVGVFASNEDAQRAASEYAAKQGYAMTEWRISDEGEPPAEGETPDLEAEAYPANKD